MTSETADPQPHDDQGSTPTHSKVSDTDLISRAVGNAYFGRLPIFPVYPTDDGVCACPKGDLCDKPGRHPIFRGGVAEASWDVVTIGEWWKAEPNAMIGVATGRGAGFVVHDPRRTDDHGRSFDALIKRYGPRPDGSKSPFLVQPFSDWASEVDAAPDPGWLAEPVWPADAYGVLAGEAKAGKTWAQLDLVISVATGTDWMGAYPTTRGAVVVFLGEGGERNTMRRLRAILTGRGLTEQDLGDRLNLCFQIPHLSEDGHIQEMERVLAEIGDVRLVILDPLYLAAGGTNGASLFDMATPLEAAQHVTQQAGAALQVVHHFNQTGAGASPRRMSGAGPEEWGRVLATLNVTTSTVSDDGRTETTYLAWSFTGSEIVPTTLTVKRTISVENRHDLTSPITYEIEPTDAVTKISGTVQVVLNVLADHDGWLTTGEVHDQVSSSRDAAKRTVENALSSLQDQGQIDRQGLPATGYSYRIPSPSSTGSAQ
jgi:hypothetical protein